jgi:hypothetical protein
MDHALRIQFCSIPSSIHFIEYKIPMTFVFARPILVLLPLAFVGVAGDRGVQAQSLETTQPLPLPIGIVATPTVGQLNAAPSSGHRPRQLRNYIGIGGSLGVSGARTGLSEGGAALITKNDLNDSLSIRGVSVFGSHRTDNTIALTVNFPVRSRSGKVQFVPFAGGGVLLSSKYNFDDFIVRGLVTGGVDIPVSRRLAATTAVNVGFTDEPNIGVQLGIAYNF